MRLPVRLTGCLIRTMHRAIRGLLLDFDACVTTEAPEMRSASVARCPKCGTVKKSGKRSCCARGGSWFNKCGDAGDTNFDHTWVEGIRACTSTLSTVRVFVCELCINCVAYMVEISRGPFNHSNRRFISHRDHCRFKGSDDANHNSRYGSPVA